ncbi:MAG: hypothetical protein ACOX8M_00380 [Marvinbryantia sp.]|jgi:hypothetical protein
MAQDEFSWMNDPSLKGIDTAKLQMLMQFAAQGKGKSQNDLLPFLMTAVKQSQSNGTSFSSQEADLIINVMKQGKSPEEIAKIDRMLTMLRQMRGKR